MSYVGPDFEPPQPRRRRGPLTVALAALVPGALLGWLVYATVGDGRGAAAEGRSPVRDMTRLPPYGPETGRAVEGPQMPSPVRRSTRRESVADTSVKAPEARARR